MTSIVGTLSATARADSRPLFRYPLQWLAGFYFSFRFAVTYIAFQSNPRAGTIITLVCSALILAVAVFYTIGDDQFSFRSLLANRTIRWVLAYLALSGVSLLWTAADSILDATGLWSGTVMETAIVLLLVKEPDAGNQTDALFRGFIVGMLAIGAIAWMGPTLPDLRIGDYDFLHPNMIGMYSALAFFLAQYLSLQERIWRWACLALGITVLRTISKTTIIALLIAEVFYLFRETRISRKRKIQFATIAIVVFLAFGSLLSSYLENYAAAGSGSEFETLTGRTAIWATAFFIAIEKPWIGHGFYSLRALMPAFDNGNFEPWHAHNELLQEFFEYGLLGVAVTIALYRSLFMTARRFTAKISPALSPTSQPYGALVLTVMLFALIHGLTESVNFGLTIPLWFFAALAIVLDKPQMEAATA